MRVAAAGGGWVRSGFLNGFEVEVDEVVEGGLVLDVVEVSFVVAVVVFGLRPDCGCCGDDVALAVDG